MQTRISKKELKEKRSTEESGQSPPAKSKALLFPIKNIHGTKPTFSNLAATLKAFFSEGKLSTPVMDY